MYKITSYLGTITILTIVFFSHIHVNTTYACHEELPHSIDSTEDCSAFYGEYSEADNKKGEASAGANTPSSNTPDQSSENQHYIELLAPFDRSQNKISTRDKGAIEIMEAYVSQIFKFGIALISVFSILMMMVAGYEYLTAGAETSRADNAKTRMMQSLLGITLVFLSALLLNVINPNFFTL